MAAQTALDSPLELLPRELRQMINKELLQVPGGLSLLAVDMTKTAPIQSIAEYHHSWQNHDASAFGGQRPGANYHIYLDVMATFNTPGARDALDAFLAMRWTSTRISREMIEDLFYLNEVHIKIVRASTLGSGPPPEIRVHPMHLRHVLGFTISASRARGTWTCTGGGKDLTIKIGEGKKKTFYAGFPRLATPISSDPFTTSIAAMVNVAGGRFPIRRVLHWMDHASDII